MPAPLRIFDETLKEVNFLHSKQSQESKLHAYCLKLYGRASKCSKSQMPIRNNHISVSVPYSHDLDFETKKVENIQVNMLCATFQG